MYLHAIQHTSLYPHSHFERLEFLGDAILGFIVAQTLFKLYPKKDEGFLSKLKSFLISRQYLNQIGKNLKLDQWIEALEDVKKHSEDYIGNSLEALIGALYLDQGIQAVESFVSQYIIQELLKDPEKILKKIPFYTQDPISLLFIKVNQHQLGELKFQFESIQKGFRCKLYLSDHFIAEAEGRSKQIAKKKAAERGLKLLNLLPGNDSFSNSEGH